MSKVTINEVELELDLMDADVVEKFDNLNAEIAVEIKNPEHYEGLSNADCMRVQCRMVDSYFDRLFGEGTADRIFPKRNNLGDRIEAFGQTVSMSKEQDSIIKSMTEKYTGQRVQNRQQRRAEQRKGGKNKHQNRNNFNAVNNG